MDKLNIGAVAMVNAVSEGNINFLNFQTEFLGLAPFLRMSIAGQDLLPIGQEMMLKLETDADNANLWMNLSTVMFCLQQRDLGLAMQSQALDMQRVYIRPAVYQPVKFRLLMIMVANDLAANTPLDCLLENSDVELIFSYIHADASLALPIPEHDALLVAISESDENQDVLANLQKSLADWPKPIINPAQNIPATARCAAALLLHDAPGLFICPTFRMSRAQLMNIARGKALLADLSADCVFPIILRPVGSHGGKGLEKLASPAEIDDYLSKIDADAFYLSRFIDYRSADGMYRKYRIALVEGVAYACHMGISTNWMIHYVNAGMYEDAQKRSEEEAFMANFEQFSAKHHAALTAIYTRTQLHYVCIDCAETVDGQLLVFEIDHAMVVHAMDPIHQFPYKQLHMQKLQNAFRNFLFRLGAVHAS